jgi:twitching motility protein PilU
MSMMDRILRLMAERKASDVYLSAHAPAIIKINGQYIPMNSQILPVEATVNLLAEVVPPNRIEELKETSELNMGLPAGRCRALSASVPCASAAPTRR